MNCPYCDADLNLVDQYGYFAAHQSGKKLGDIYQCPNHEGFENQESALNYNPDYSITEWEDICCESSVFNGFFYTDKSDSLKEGYPC